MLSSSCCKDDSLNVSVTSSVSQILREIDSKQLEDEENAAGEDGNASAAISLVSSAHRQQNPVLETAQRRMRRNANEDASQGEDEYSSEFWMWFLNYMA